ncbi:MAG: zinc transporter ZupT [Saprospiraceae bacterium]|jgi:zinc transporter ZupT
MGLIQLLLFSSVLIGGGLAFYLRQNNKNLIQLLLSFSGAYILGITFLHLVPETYAEGKYTGLFILLGFFIQLMLEQLSRGVEHGHIHALHDAKSSAAFAIMLGLCLHAFIEGLPLGIVEHIHDHNHNHNHDHIDLAGVGSEEAYPYHLLFGIILHKIPAAFALGILLLLSGFKDKTVLLYLVIFGSMSPLAAAIGGYLDSQGLLSPDIRSAIMAIVIGSFLHIATTILFETDTNHKIPTNKLIAVLVGLGIAILTVSF